MQQTTAAAAATMPVIRNVTAISRVILIVSHLFQRQPSDGPSYLWKGVRGESS